jgi:hypothetical protein
MNREVHVRIWERPEVRVLRATRQLLPHPVAGFFGSSAPQAFIAEHCDPRRKLHRLFQEAGDSLSW